MTLQPGQDAAVAVAVATLWTSPDAARPVDSPALGMPADVRGWVSGMTADERRDLDGRTLSQVLLGDPVRVTEVRDGWAKVIATAQPAPKLDPRGYPGWLPVDQLTAAGEPDGDRVVVDATSTALRDAPDGDVVVPGVILGTPLTSLSEPYRGWRQVAVPGFDEPLWARDRDLTAEPAGEPQAADVLAVAGRMLDVPYIWGGVSAYGIDCSGLVYLAHRRLGVAVARDADEQHAAAKPVQLGEERPGDLYFFAREGKGVHHVGFAAGEGRMLHADYTARQVVLEPLSEERRATLVSAARLLP